MGFDVGYIAYIYPNSGASLNGSEVYGSHEHRHFDDQAHGAPAAQSTSMRA